jgi:hypothetical protein
MHYWDQISNKIDRQCFACGHLKENVWDMLLCPSVHQQAAHSKAINEFCTQLSWYHTPAPMSSIIIDCLQQWLSGTQPTIVLLPTNDEDPNAHLHWLINEAYSDQSNIG